MADYFTNTAEIRKNAQASCAGSEKALPTLIKKEEPFWYRVPPPTEKKSNA
jgi:hypothetical protein